MSNIFSDGAGLIVGPQIADKKQIISITTTDSGTIFATAPVTSVRISQQTDFNLAKTLAGNFNLVVFQDLPVTIHLSGLRVLKQICGGSSSDSIGNLYKTLKGSADKKVTITIGGKEQYQGVVVALQQHSTASQMPGIMTYQLTLFGVRSK